MPQRKVQKSWQALPVRVIAQLLDVPMSTVYQWKRKKILTGYTVQDVGAFIHKYLIFHGVSAWEPWHTLVEEDIDPDDEGLPVSPHSLRYDPPKRPRGRPKTPERHPRKQRPPNP